MQKRLKKIAKEKVKENERDRQYGRYLSFRIYERKLSKISDRSVAERVAVVLLKRYMRSKNGDGRVWIGDAEGCFLKFLPADECDRLFDLASNDSDCGSLLVLARGMPKESFHRRRQAVQSRFAEGDKISFAGFYCGMPLKDYVINHVAVLDPIGEDVSVKIDDRSGKATVKRIVFERTERYKLFEKEDGEFWPAYLRKYVPSQKKQKSFSETVDDLLDRGTFDYQEGWEDSLDQECYIYKSLKYGTRVLFGQKTGVLVLEEYK